MRNPIPIVAEEPKITTESDAPASATFFGKKTKARITQIEDILKTLRSLGKLE